METKQLTPQRVKELQAEIRELCEEKNAVILAHYYTTGDIQEVADFIGDSLALARQAAATNADIIVMCGVHFMAETCKLLSPDKKVLVPDPDAGCSLADSCNAEDLRKWKEEHPDHLIVQYVNTTAATKALTDVVVTSGNAKKVVDQLPKNAKILFGPDYNLGAYINSVTGRNMELWNGGCHVHERFSVEAIAKLKAEHPEKDWTFVSELMWTSETVKRLNPPTFIVATEAGIMHELKRMCPDCTFLPVPPEISEGATSCGCNECQYMKMNTLKKLRNCLLYGAPEVTVSEEIAKDAVKPINKMLKLS